MDCEQIEVDNIFGSKLKTDEILYLLHGLKPAVRQMFFSNEIEKVQQFCVKNGIFCVQSNFKVLIADSNEAFSNKGLRAPINDSRDGAIVLYISKDERKAHLAALATSAATKCQYCIPFHIAQAKRLGATEDELKAAVQIAADVMRMSTMFYGNEFDLDEFKAMLKN